MMEAMEPETAALISSLAAAVSAVLTLIAVVTAVLSLSASRQDAKNAEKNAAEDRRAQDRPLIVPEFQKEYLSDRTLNFVIRNWGRSAATNVRIEILEPALDGDVEDLANSDVLKWLHRSYATPISLWPPEWRMTHVYAGIADERRALALRVSYLGPDGHGYSEEFRVDPTPLMSQTEIGRSEPNSRDADGWFRDIGRTLRAIARKM